MALERKGIKIRGVGLAAEGGIRLGIGLALGVLLGAEGGSLPSVNRVAGEPATSGKSLAGFPMALD